MGKRNEDDKLSLNLSAPPFVSKVDVPAIVGQFLNDTRLEDLISELIQNELDAGSTETTIHFGKDELTCKGNGEPVSEQGWKRLAVVLGAGSDVAAKENGIGAKNHGLKVGFLLGNTVRVESGGKRTLLTLCTDDGHLSPGAWEYPQSDLRIPERGCSIYIPYREKELFVPSGETFTLPIITPEFVNKLFHDAVEQASYRFLGVIRPRFITEYKLSLSHWRDGEFVFKYKSRPLKGARGKLLYRRVCTLTDPAGVEQVCQQEDVYTFPVYIPGCMLSKVPDFYRDGKKVIAQIAWRVDGRGRPEPTSGKIRYPIEYPNGAKHAYDGTGFHISAPFISDRARHGITENERNKLLIEECERAFINLLKRFLIPEFGPSALYLLASRDAFDKQVTSRLVQLAAEQGALPAASLRKKNKVSKIPRNLSKKYRCIGSKVTEGLRFVIPCASWDLDQINPTLATLCPPEYQQLHADTPGFVIRALTEPLYGKPYPQGLNYSTFDDNDAITRLNGTSSWYPWLEQDTWESEMKNPYRVTLYLDIADASLRMAGGAKAERISALQAVCLPTSKETVVEWTEIYSAKSHVPEIPGVTYPNILHPLLEGHRIFNHKELNLKPFDLDEYLSRLSFAGYTWAAEVFFGWLAQNMLTLRHTTLEKIAQFPIWKTSGGEFVPLQDICIPTDKLFAKALSSYIKSPSEAVASFIQRNARKKSGVFKPRILPKESEVRLWYAELTAKLPASGVQLSAADIAVLNEIEDVLDALDAKGLLDGLDSIFNGFRTVNGDGVLVQLDSLHLETGVVRACRLPHAFLVGRANKARLYSKLGVRTTPASYAIFMALKTDPSNQGAFYRRIRAFLADQGDPDLLKVTPCLLIDGKIRAPGALALEPKSRIDFWGAWKYRINTRLLSPEDEQNLRLIGVQGRGITEDASKDFFKWLESQSESILERHLIQVIRHWRDNNGPSKWCKDYSSIKCIPIRNSAGQITLAATRDVLKGKVLAYLPDFPGLEGQIVSQGANISFAIVEAATVPGSIFEKLRNIGIETLRKASKRPLSVSFMGPAKDNKQFTVVLDYLKSKQMFHELPKRLEELQVPERLMRRGWRSIMAGFGQVREVDSIVSRYKLARYQFDVLSEYGIHDESKSILLSRGAPDPDTAFYECLAYLVFDEDKLARESLPVWHYVFPLKKAIQMEFRHRFKPMRRGMHEEELVDDEDFDYRDDADAWGNEQEVITTDESKADKAEYDRKPNCVFRGIVNTHSV